MMPLNINICLSAKEKQIAAAKGDAFLELQHFSLASPQEDSSGCAEMLTVITWEQGMRDNKAFMNTIKCPTPG